MSLELLPILATVGKDATLKQVFELVNCEHRIINEKSKTFCANVTKEQLETLIGSGYLVDIVEDKSDNSDMELHDAGVQSLTIIPTTEPRFERDSPWKGSAMVGSTVDDNNQLWRHTTKAFTLSGFPGDFNVKQVPKSFETSIATDFTISEVRDLKNTNESGTGYYGPPEDDFSVGWARGSLLNLDQLERWVAYGFYYRYYGDYTPDNPNLRYPTAEAVKTFEGGKFRWTIQYIAHRGSRIWTTIYEQEDDWFLTDTVSHGKWKDIYGNIRPAEYQFTFEVNSNLTRSATEGDLKGPFTRTPLDENTNNDYYRYLNSDGTPNKEGPVFRYVVDSNGQHRWKYQSIANNESKSLIASFISNSHFYPWTNPNWTTPYADFTTIMRDTNYQETSAESRTTLTDFADGQYIKDVNGNYNGPNNKKFEHSLVSSVEGGTHTYKWTFKDTLDNIVKASGSPVGVIDSANWTSPSANDNIVVSPKVELWDANWTGTALSATRFITLSSFLDEDMGKITTGKTIRQLTDVINENKIIPEQQIFNATYSWDNDGSNVDVVVQEGIVKHDHPEWLTQDGSESRFVKYDWGALYPDGSSEQKALRTAHKYDNINVSKHATSVASHIAGRKYGWAKGAKIYNLNNFSNRLGQSLYWDPIKRFHDAKPVEELKPGIFAKRPTVVNASWGFINYYDGTHNGPITSFMFRNRYVTDQTLFRKFTELKKYGLFLRGSMSHRFAESWARSIDAMTDSGVIYVSSAGNNKCKISIPGEIDWNNYVTALAPVYDSYVKTKNYYQRGSLLGQHSICVGATTFDVQAHPTQPGGRQETMTYFSTKGPGVDISIQGDEVMTPGDGGYGQRVGGTSFSGPGVAGMIALLVDRYPMAKPNQVKQFCRTKMVAPQKVLDISPDAVAPTDDTGASDYFGTFDFEVMVKNSGYSNNIGYIDPVNLGTTYYSQVTAMSGFEPIGDHYENMEKIKPLRIYPEYYEANFSGRINFDKSGVSEEEAGPSPRAFKYYKFVFYRFNDRTNRAGCSNRIGFAQGEHPDSNSTDRRVFNSNYRNYDSLFNTAGMLFGTLNFYDKNGDMVFGKTPYVSGSGSDPFQNAPHVTDDFIRYKEGYIGFIRGTRLSSKNKRDMRTGEGFVDNPEGIFRMPTQWDSTSALLLGTGYRTIGGAETATDIKGVNSTEGQNNGWKTPEGRALYKSITYHDVASAVTNGYKFYNQDISVHKHTTQNTGVKYKTINTGVIQSQTNTSIARKFATGFGHSPDERVLYGMLKGFADGKPDYTWVNNQWFDKGNSLFATWGPHKLFQQEMAPGAHGWNKMGNLINDKLVKVRLAGFSLGTTSVPTALNVTKADSVGGNTDAFTDLKFFGTTEGEYIARFNTVIPQNITVNGFTGSSSYANGTYTKQSGTINGKPYWNSGNNQIKYTGTQWQINDTDTPGTFAVNLADTSVPPDTGWTLAGIFDGITPAGTPTFTFAEDDNPNLKRAYKFAKKTSTNTISDGSDTASTAAVGDWVLFVGTQLYNGTIGTLDEMNDIPIVKDYVAVNLDFGNGTSPASITGFTISTNSTSISDRYPDGIDGDYRPLLLTTANGAAVDENGVGARGQSSITKPGSALKYNWCHNYKKLFGKLDDLPSDGLREQRHYKELSITYDYSDSRWYILSQKSDGTDKEYLFRTNQYRHPMTQAPSGISTTKFLGWDKPRSVAYDKRHWIDMITPTQATDTDINGVNTLTWEVHPSNPYTGSTVGTLSVVDNEDFRSEVFLEFDNPVDFGQITYECHPIMQASNGGIYGPLGVQAMDIFASDSGDYNSYVTKIAGMSEMRKVGGHDTYLARKVFKDRVPEALPTGVAGVSRQNTPYMGVNTPSGKPGGFTSFDTSSGTPVNTQDAEGRYVFQSAIEDGEYSFNAISNSEVKQPDVPNVAPSRVSNPDPGHESVGVANQNLTLSWNHAANYEKYKIFFGTRFHGSSGLPTDTYMLETTDNRVTIFETATANNTIFRWRVDPVNSTGTTSGKQFQFTTLPVYVSPSAGGGGTILKRGVPSSDPITAFNPVNNATEQSTNVGKLQWIEPGTKNLSLTGLGNINE